MLNVANGTLILRTGQLRTHNRADLLAFALAVSYDASATCPSWAAFLARIQAENQRMITFLQKAIGYALTGVIREHVLLFSLGARAQRQKYIPQSPSELLGAYAMKAPSELLMVSHNDRHPTERARPWASALSPLSRPNKAGVLAEVFVKEATGGDPIRARRMREDSGNSSRPTKSFLPPITSPTLRGRIPPSGSVSNWSHFL